MALWPATLALMLLTSVDTPTAGSSSLSSDDVIDLAGINSGEQPASIVIVPYIDKKLEAYEPDEAKWEEVESVGDPESVTLLRQQWFRHCDPYAQD